MRTSVRSLERAILILTIFALAACAPGSAPVAPTQAPSPAVAQPVAAQQDAAATEMPAATTTAAPPAVAPPTASPTATAPVAAAAPEPIFGPAWGDRNAYRTGLIESEQPTLERLLPGAAEYRIQLEIPESMEGASGRQQVRYTNNEDRPLEEVYMRLFPNALGGGMSVRDVTVDGATVTPEYRYERTAVRVPLPQPLAPGQSAIIELWYEIEVPLTLDKGYGILSYTGDVLALDSPYAPVPVYNAEGWNVETPPENADTSFNDASFYLVQVTAPAAVTVVATGVEVDSSTRDSARGEVRETTFALGPARDFSLAASAKYTVATEQAGETRINSYALPGEEKARDAALTDAAAALEIYSRRFGPYPYTEFDVSTTPMLALGIEYPGAVGITRRVYDPQQTGTGPALESTVAHEAAHQWFYNLVGSDQIDEPWLDEALAQYGTWLYYLDRYGAQAAEGWRQTWISRWDRVEAEKKPVGLPAAAYSRGEYGAIVYGRGPLFLEALAQRMGQEKFDAFLADYAQQFRWGIATSADFKRMASEACECQLDDLYEKWLEP